MRYGSVYKVNCAVTNKPYIGITVDSVENRLTQHIWFAFTETKQRSDTKFARAIRKHGPDAFTIEEIAVCFDKDSLMEFEEKLIAKFDSFNNGYNSTTSSRYGGKHCIEVCEKKSKSQLRRFENPEERIKQGLKFQYINQELKGVA